MEVEAGRRRCKLGQKKTQEMSEARQGEVRRGREEGSGKESEKKKDNGSCRNMTVEGGAK